jgi:hypothetical protein
LSKDLADLIRPTLHATRKAYDADPDKYDKILEDSGKKISVKYYLYEEGDNLYDNSGFCYAVAILCLLIMFFSLCLFFPYFFQSKPRLNGMKRKLLFIAITMPLAAWFLHVLVYLVTGAGVNLQMTEVIAFNYPKDFSQPAGLVIISFLIGVAIQFYFVFFYFHYFKAGE